MQRLRLFKSRERLEALLQDATAKEASYADFLDTLLAEEVASKTAKHVTMRTHLARFPFVKSLETFDFSYQPSLDKKQIQTLSSCHFIEHGENVVFLGPPGVGKSHLAVGLGLKAIEHGYRVLFATAAGLITALTKAATEGRLEERLKIYTVPRLLISEATAQAIDGEIARILDAAHRRVRETLTARRSALEALAKLLIDKEVIDADQLRALRRLGAAAEPAALVGVGAVLAAAWLGQRRLRAATCGERLPRPPLGGRPGPARAA